jgi:Tol biopolymer transport system component
MRANGHQDRRLTHNDAIDAGPDFSPNGNRIAFYSGRDGDYEVFVMRPSGAHQRQLTHDALNQRSPVFSPNGRSVAFGTNDASIDKMRADGSHARPITPAGYNVDAAWQPIPRKRHHHH